MEKAQQVHKLITITGRHMWCVFRESKPVPCDAANTSRVAMFLTGFIAKFN